MRKGTSAQLSSLRWPVERGQIQPGPNICRTLLPSLQRSTIWQPLPLAQKHQLHQVWALPGSLILYTSTPRLAHFHCQEAGYTPLTPKYFTLVPGALKMTLLLHLQHHTAQQPWTSPRALCWTPRRVFTSSCRLYLPSLDVHGAGQRRFPARGRTDSQEQFPDAEGCCWWPQARSWKWFSGRSSSVLECLQPGHAGCCGHAQTSECEQKRFLFR